MKRTNNIFEYIAFSERKIARLSAYSGMMTIANCVLLCAVLKMSDEIHRLEKVSEKCK